jgi:hypothetical protein
MSKALAIPQIKSDLMGDQEYGNWLKTCLHIGRRGKKIDSKQEGDI